MGNIPQKGTRFRNLRLQFKRQIADSENVRYGVFPVPSSDTRAPVRCREALLTPLTFVQLAACALQSKRPSAAQTQSTSETSRYCVLFYTL